MKRHHEEKQKTRKRVTICNTQATKYYYSKIHLRAHTNQDEKYKQHNSF